MEQLTETISLDVDEANELAFKLKVEGASSPAKVRLVCESGDVSYMFNGRGTGEDGVVQFVIPQMKGKLTEGTYSARVEVLIENRYFSPVQFQINFKKTMQVFAESLQIVSAPKPEIRVTAQPVVVARPVQRQEQRPVVIQPPAPIPVQKSPPPAPPLPAPEKQQVDRQERPRTLREKFSFGSR